MNQQPKKMSTALVVVMAVVGLSFACCFGTMLLGGAKTSTGSIAAGAPRSSRSEPAKPREPQFEVSAIKLWEDYHSNEVAADEVYKDKVLEVRGKVHSITKDFAGSIVVQLEARNPYMSTHATLESSQSASAAKLAKSQDVALVCTGGGMVVGSPVLRDCVLLP